MFIDAVTGLWESWPENEYFDSTTEVCRTCNGSCNDECMANIGCLECPAGQNLNLHSLQCQDSWDGIIIESSDLSIEKVCRIYSDTGEIEYYVDPQSTQPLELGTYEYPYRSLKSANFEILNFFSHSDISVVIYITDAYVEDDTNVYINMTSVKVTAHPDYTSIFKTPMLIPTSITQPSMFDKSLFHLLQTTDANITEIAGRGSFDEYETVLLGFVKNTFLPIQTGFSFQGIDIYREETSEDPSQYFIFWGNLGSKGIHIGKLVKSDPIH